DGFLLRRTGGEFHVDVDDYHHDSRSQWHQVEPQPRNAEPDQPGVAAVGSSRVQCDRYRAGHYALVRRALTCVREYVCRRAVAVPRIFHDWLSRRVFCSTPPTLQFNKVAL